MNTHETYVSLKVAKLLKQAGFDWKCIRYYQNDDETLYGPLVEQYKLVETNFNVAPVYMEQYSAPTLDVAQRWLREVKGIHIDVDTWPAALWRWVVWKIMPERRIIASEHSNYKSYEEAQEAGIKKCLTLILEQE